MDVRTQAPVSKNQGETFVIDGRWTEVVTNHVVTAKSAASAKVKISIVPHPSIADANAVKLDEATGTDLSFTVPSAVWKILVEIVTAPQPVVVTWTGERE